MQTKLADFIKDTAEGKEAEDILRACIHCGMCTATCPTYRLLGDERDGPRGRIYLIKQVLEGTKATEKTQTHLDRCLTCRTCESVCPAGVRYGRLLDIGRGIVEQQVPRPWLARLKREVLCSVLPYPRRFALLFKLLCLVPFSGFKARSESVTAGVMTSHARTMLVLKGCVQPTIAPGIDLAAAKILDHLGIRLIEAPAAGCCGAVSYHLSKQEDGLNFMRRNIDAWLPFLDAGAEAIIVTASGCGLMVKEYAEALKHDADYAAKARRVSEAARDVVEVVESEGLTALKLKPVGKIAFQSPCTLQHGQQLGGRVEALLSRLGVDLCPVADAQICCGSAGTYSVLQPEISKRLLKDKIGNLEKNNPDVIATANIGCLAHIQSATVLPVKHWVEIVAAALPDGR